MNKRIISSLAALVPLLILAIPRDWIPLDGLTVVQQRVMALFVLAALFWVLEPIPIYATSILVIVLELVLISDQALVWLRPAAERPGMGAPISYRDIMGTFASPIILLFLGGFFLAMAATKYRLDQNLARILLRPFGKEPRWVMLGLMIITAVFSMFMSNTATTAMMLSILAPVLASFDAGDGGRVAFALSIPVAANIGGIGTPIGTPPNAIALKYLTGDLAIGFGEWMTFGIPFVVVMLFFAWVLIGRLFPIQTAEIKLSIRGKFLKNLRARVVYVTFSATILLWLTDFLHGMNAYVVAMIPVAVFLSTGIITKEDLKRLSWDVLWLVAGGIALGLALEQSGLASLLVAAIPFDQFSGFVVLVAGGLLAVVMANFMSNTATANLLLPIVAALGASMGNLASLGGAGGLILGVTLASSLGMALPISTPPNALAHATGEITTAQLSRTGLIVGAFGFLLVLGFILMLKQIHFFQ